MLYIGLEDGNRRVRVAVVSCEGMAGPGSGGYGCKRPRVSSGRSSPTTGTHGDRTAMCLS